MKLASTFAITALFALVYSIVFVIGIMFLPEGWVGLVIMILLTLGIVFLQYAISPLIIGWIYRINWIEFDQYQRQFPHLAETVMRVVQEKGIKMPRLGIIADLNPNAFTFGWTKNSARVVITEGILKYLDKKEQKAVVGHEMGHVIHNDFILMTVVFAIPLVLLTIARWAYWTARGVGLSSDSDNAAYVTMALYAIGVLSYIAYWIGFLISLFISRIREYYADEYSAEVIENPNALSTGLVKIAYGLLEQRSVTDNRKSQVYSLQGLGIMDTKSAPDFAYTSMENSGNYSDDAIQAAAAWDLYNPWAKYYEIFSTHPLPAKRINRLNDQCELYGKRPEIEFTKAKQIKEEQAGKSMLPEFATDLTIKLSPILVLALGGLFTILWIFNLAGFLPEGDLIFSRLNIADLLLYWAVIFFIVGAAVIMRTRFMFKSDFERRTVRQLVSNVKVSPIRCEAAVLEGQIVGRGMPGYYFGEDLYFQDGSGLMYVDYRSGIPFGNFFFAIARVKKLIGQQVRIIGWYRRGPTPFIQVHRIEVPAMGKTYRNYYKYMTYLWAVLAFIVGAVLLYFWI